MQATATQRGTVLIVEDNADIREALHELLQDERYAVLEASDGLAGLALLRASRVGLVVLLDYLMPRMDGFAMMRAAVADPGVLARHTFILLTANDDRLPAAFETLLEMLHMPIIGKPFELDDLLDAVAAAELALAAHAEIADAAEDTPESKPPAAPCGK